MMKNISIGESVKIAVKEFGKTIPGVGSVISVADETLATIETNKMKNNICQIQSNQNLTEVSIINLHLNDKIPKKYMDELQKNLNIYYNEREDYEDYENCVNLDCILDDIIVSEDCISLNLSVPVDRETVYEEIKILIEWTSVRCPGNLGIHIKDYSYEY